MKRAGNNDAYSRFYTDLNFDRAGLFELITLTLEVLIHINGKKYQLEEKPEDMLLKAL